MCVDLKMSHFLLGQQAGDIKYSCFLHLCNRRVMKEHSSKQLWPTRTPFTVRERKNVINQSLVST